MDGDAEPAVAFDDAVELIIGVLKCRPPGMRINLMPLYAWYVLVAAGGAIACLTQRRAA